MPPNSATAKSTAAPALASSATLVVTKRTPPPQFGHQRLAGRRIHVGDQHPGALPGQQASRRSAEPRRTAGNKEYTLADLHGCLRK